MNEFPQRYKKRKLTLSWSLGTTVEEVWLSSTGMLSERFLSALTFYLKKRFAVPLLCRDKSRFLFRDVFYRTKNFWSGETMVQTWQLLQPCRRVGRHYSVCACACVYVSLTCCKTPRRERNEENFPGNEVAQISRIHRQTENVRYAAHARYQSSIDKYFNMEALNKIQQVQGNNSKLVNQAFLAHNRKVLRTPPHPQANKSFSQTYGRYQVWVWVSFGGSTDRKSYWIFPTLTVFPDLHLTQHLWDELWARPYH